MANGWIKLFRQITESWMWTSDEPFDRRSAWVDLLLLANHEDNKIVYKGEVIHCKRGQVNRSFKWLCQRWHRSRWWVTTTLKLFEKDGMITINATTHQTTVTLVNYDKFQDSPTTDQTTDQTTSHTTNQTTSRQHTRMYKNVKEREEIKRGRDRPRFNPPSLEEVTDYFWKIESDSDPQQFIDYYSTRGWRLSKGLPMADWKAAARSWKRRGAERTQEQANRWGNDPDQRKEYGGEIDWGID